MKEVANFSSKNTDSTSEIEVNYKIFKKIIKKWPTLSKIIYFANIRIDKANYVPSAIHGLFKKYLPHPSERSLFLNPITEIEKKLKL